jgi:hypothetical protein
MATSTTSGPDEESQGEQPEMTGRPLAESVAARCLAEDATPAFAYLVDERKVDKRALERAMQHGTVAFSTWRHHDKTRGTVGHGGPAVAFITLDRVDGAAAAVDMHYVDPDSNGGQKICTKGERAGFPWCSDWSRIENAKTVYVVDSAINALSVESCLLPASAVVATRGTANLDKIDWTFLRGKAVVACFGNDPPAQKGPLANYCPGQHAGWQLHEILTGLDTSCLLVDQSGWFEDTERKKPIRDTNAYLQAHGFERLTLAMKQLEEWVIPGLPALGQREGRARLYFPSHDWMAYIKYRVQPDFTRTLDRQIKDDDTGETRWTYNDVSGFRIAAMSRVQIASPTSTMTGDKDQSPATVFAVSVQTPRHGSKLLRRVVDDEKLHNLDVWKKLGPVFSPAGFSRLVNVWERAAGIGARYAVNFVGLAWRDGVPIVNEGPDCFFQDPRQQCPYHALTFPSGKPEHGMHVIRAYQKTFKANAAAIPLVWALGAHLKAFLGFWPHFVMQAEKGSGKSTVIKRIERSIAMTMFSRQSMQTEFRMLTTMSYTSHPVGWEEISAGRQDMIDKAVAQLQESYQYSHTRRGSDMTDFLLCAPVLLAGEDVPVEGLTGKVVRCQLRKSRRGQLLDDKLPVFPVKEWLQFLARCGKDYVLALHNEQLAYFAKNCVAASDTGAERMVTNYAALATAWYLLSEFTGVPEGSWDFVSCVVEEMNSHITETVSDRQPWALIVEKLLGEIASHQFRHPFKFDTEDEVPVLCVRTSYVMSHISQSPHLRPFWDRMTVKSDRIFKQQLAAAGVLLMDPDQPGKALHVERSIRGVRESHMVCIHLSALEKFGLHATIPEEKTIPDFGMAKPRREEATT